MGISRYGDKSKSLLKNPPSMKMDALSMTLQQNVPQQERQYFRFGLQEMGLIAFIIYKIYEMYH